MFDRNRIATFVAEGLGTGLLTLIFLSVQRSTIGVPFFIALAAGLAVAVLVVALGRVTSAHLNPAVTIALWTIRRVSTLRAFVLIVAQILGAWGAFFLYRYLAHQNMQPIGGDYSSRVLVAEAMGGVVLGLAWATAAYHQLTLSAKAAFVSAAYVFGIIVASSAALGIVNPAVALGARAWEWGTYVAGPILGVVLGANLYGLLFAPRTAVVTRPKAVVAEPAETAPAKARTTTTAKATKKPAAKASKPARASKKK